MKERFEFLNIPDEERKTVLDFVLNLPEYKNIFGVEETGCLTIKAPVINSFYAHDSTYDYLVIAYCFEKEKNIIIRRLRTLEDLDDKILHLTDVPAEIVNRLKKDSSPEVMEDFYLKAIKQGNENIRREIKERMKWIEEELMDIKCEMYNQIGRHLIELWHEVHKVLENKKGNKP